MILFVFLVACAATYAEHYRGKAYYDLDNATNLYKDFVEQYNKVYNPEEYLRRLDIFKESLKEINENNSMDSLTEFGINHFADLTAEERKRYCGFKPVDDSFHELAVKLDIPAEQLSGLPDSFDWRDHNAVTHVKNQMGCGSCWIFSATGNIEGQYAIKHNRTVGFSEQQSLDCVHPADGISNCNGGWPHMVMHHDARGVGVIAERDYKYNARQSKCQEDPTEAWTHVDSFTVYTPTEDALQKLLYEQGPLSVALQGSGLFFYEGGIGRPDKVCKGYVNHAVLLVGYGEEKGVKYWIIKNSWSDSWGEKGYLRLERGVNACKMGSSYTATCTVK